MPNEVDDTARDLSLEYDDTILFMCYLMLGAVNHLPYNSSLSETRDEAMELKKVLFRTRRLPLGFVTLSMSLNNAPGIVRPPTQKMEVADIEKDGNGVLGHDSHSALTLLYMSQSLQFSIAVQTKTKQGTKRPISVLEGTMY